MEWISSFIEIVLHLDAYLALLLEQYGLWLYAILFIIIFAETGLVVTPFLPGDSLLFVAGALCGVTVHTAAATQFNIGILMITLSVAAILGNVVNYHIGHYLGPRVFQFEDSRLLNQKALKYAHDFYEKHGGKTLVISRFLPILRTFAPFVAGIGRMNYVAFSAYNILGGVLWVVLLCVAGYYLGNTPWVKNNLSLVIMAIIVLSLLPAFWAYWRGKRAHGSTPPHEKTEIG